MADAQNKLRQFENDPLYTALSPEERLRLGELASAYRLSVQDLRKILTAACDLEMWGEGPFFRHWPGAGSPEPGGRTPKHRKRDLGGFFEAVEALRRDNRYDDFTPDASPVEPAVWVPRAKEETILGTCPVASEKTRCCNLITLDAVMRCGFDCTYCSIQSFYGKGRVHFRSDLRERLAEVSGDLDPGQLYHIGTGQSSDSLMWGNRDGLLDALREFAAANPNVILELKSKAANPAPLLENPVPRNMIATWSLNTPTIVGAEERGTASVTQRLDAARAAADAGVLVGFHFHPMVIYRGWEEEYRDLILEVQRRFSPDEVILTSFGTLTYIKPVLKRLRSRRLKSRILRMPMEDAAGKFSYPLEEKERMFSLAYGSFSEEWREKVFFYLCMEDVSLWSRVFGRDYGSNEEFEEDMKRSYREKVGFPS